MDVARRANAEISIIFQPPFQIGFVRTHEGANFGPIFQKTERRQGPNTQFALDGGKLVRVDLDENNNIRVLEGHGLENWRHVPTWAAPDLFYFIF